VCINNQCVTGFGRQYTVRAVSASFPNQNPNTMPPSTWDFGGGAPDPFVCLSLDGSMTPVACSTAVMDSFSATWNRSWDITVNSTTRVAVDAFDEDVSSNDFMGGFVIANGTGFIGVARRGGIIGPAYTGDPVNWNVTITIR
jgi:hypothetical protein